MSSAPASGRGPVNRPRSLDIVDRGIIEALAVYGRGLFLEHEATSATA